MTLLAPRLRARALAEKYVSIPLARLLQALRISPNSLTLAGLAVSIGAGYLLSEGWLIAGGAVMLAGAFLDMLDGPLARLGQQASRSGAFLDSVADRLGEAAVLFGLLVFYVRDGHELGTYLTVGALVASQMVSYLRARAEGLGIPSDVGFMGRPERVVVLGAGLLAGYPLYPLAIILALSGVTMAQRIYHTLRHS
jgi:CDP-diacylglycerol--glycerol-3-phosphate 3-phosphatidyltransferase